MRFLRIILLIPAVLLTSSDHAKSVPAQGYPTQTLYALYWSVEPGFTSTLELKNNIMARGLTVHTSLYFANGEEQYLSALQLGPRETVVVDLNRVLGPQANPGRREGSLKVWFEAKSPSVLMGSTTVANPEKGIAWNFFLYPTNPGLPNAPVGGVFWFHDSQTDGFVPVHNGSSEFMTVVPRFHIEGQVYSLPPTSIAPGRFFKLELRKELRRLGLNSATAGGLSFVYEGVPDALRAHGVLYNNKGFSAEIDFNRMDDWDEPQELALRTPRLAIGAAAPELGLPARTTFKPVLALHNFNSYTMNLTLNVGYRVGGSPTEMGIPVSLAAGQTRVLELHPYLQDVVAAGAPWASLEISYTSRHDGLAASLVSVSDDGNHSIRSVMNWVQANTREGWFWHADDGHNTILGIYNPDKEDTLVRVSLDYYVDGARRSYELLDITLAARATHIVNIADVISSGLPDNDGDVIPSSVSFGGYRVRGLNRRSEKGILTEALVISHRKKQFLAIYNTGCCEVPAWFTPTSAQVGPVGGAFYVTADSWDDCTNEPINDMFQLGYVHFILSTNPEVASEGSPGWIQMESPGNTTLTYQIYHYKNWAGGGCKLQKQEDNCNVTVVRSQVLTADIASDQIVVSLEPEGLSGTLLVTAQGPSVSKTIFSGTVSGDTYLYSFDRNNLPNGQYTSVTARWTVGGMNFTGSKSVSFNVLGTYRHSQYNTPAESACTGSQASAYKTDTQCDFDPITLKNDFISQSWLNGSGITINFGPEQNEALCLNSQFSPPADASGRSFRPQTIVPSCGSGYGISNSTVAKGDDAPLVCGDSVLILGLGGGAVTKTVTDRCPACTGNLQLDNYTTQTACQPGTIPDLGNFKTIRLR